MSQQITPNVGRLVQLSISSGGLPKQAIAEAMVAKNGVAGDSQNDRKNHGGPNRAVCLYSMELYDWLAGQGIDLEPGAVGENFTTSGIDLVGVKAGQRFAVGQCVIELTKVRKPCRNLNVWHQDLAKLIEGRSGWMASVVAEALVRPGDAIVALDQAEMGAP